MTGVNNDKFVKTRAPKDMGNLRMNAATFMKVFNSDGCACKYPSTYGSFDSECFDKLAELFSASV